MLGDMLRDAREAKGASLVDAERATKIRQKYLAALEEDNISSLPSPVYARGFLRNYAVYLGLDADEVMDVFEEARQPTRERIRAARGEPESKPAARDRKKGDRISIQPLSPEPIDTRVRYGSSYIAISLLALPLIIAFYFVYSAYAGGGSRSAPIPDVSTTVRPARTAAPLGTTVALNNPGPNAGAYNTPTTYVPLAPGVVPTNTPVPATATTATPGTDVAAQPTTAIQPSNGVVADVQITTKDAWLRVVVDGVQRYSGTLPAGTNRKWTGKNTIRIRTGRGDVVRVNINGADRGFMGTPQRLIIEKEWNKSGNETIIQR
jgi:cytoskeletal protein RodZ